MFLKTPVLFLLFIISSVCLMCLGSPTLNFDRSLFTRDACSDAVNKLVSGINDNISVQKNEKSRTNIIQKVLSAGSVDQEDFQSAKSKLVAIVTKGITIRQNNRKIAPLGNAAIAGLSTVATAQKGELKLAQGLVGKPDTDDPNLSKLQTMFSGGIQQSQQNAKDLRKGVRLAESKILRSINLNAT